MNRLRDEDETQVLTRYEEQRADRALRVQAVLVELEREATTWKDRDWTPFEWAMHLNAAVAETVRLAWHLTTAAEGHPRAYRAHSLRRCLRSAAMLALHGMLAVDRRHGDEIAELERRERA